jgi:hypothetical protein
VLIIPFLKKEQAYVFFLTLNEFLKNKILSKILGKVQAKMYSSLSTSWYKNEEKYAGKRRIWNERDEPMRKEE